MREKDLKLGAKYQAAYDNDKIVEFDGSDCDGDAVLIPIAKCENYFMYSDDSPHKKHRESKTVFGLSMGLFLKNYELVKTK